MGNTRPLTFLRERNVIERARGVVVARWMFCRMLMFVIWGAACLVCNVYFCLFVNIFCNRLFVFVGNLNVAGRKNQRQKNVSAKAQLSGAQSVADEGGKKKGRKPKGYAIVFVVIFFVCNHLFTFCFRFVSLTVCRQE